VAALQQHHLLVVARAWEPAQLVALVALTVVVVAVELNTMQAQIGGPEVLAQSELFGPEILAPFRQLV
jgi:hypothetical protein